MSAMKDKGMLIGIAYNSYDPLTGRKVDRPSEESVEQVAKDVDLILVVGSQNSSNSNRLVELAQRLP